MIKFWTITLRPDTAARCKVYVDYVRSMRWIYSVPKQDNGFYND